jgi:hypothetical protein
MWDREHARPPTVNRATFLTSLDTNPDSALDRAVEF